MRVDYSYTQLDDEELAQHLAQCQAEQEKERLAEIERRHRQYTFRFVGGMC